MTLLIIVVALGFILLWGGLWAALGAAVVIGAVWVAIDLWTAERSMARLFREARERADPEYLHKQAIKDHRRWQQAPKPRWWARKLW